MNFDLRLPLGLSGGKGERKPRIVLSVAEEPGFLLERLESRLRERDFDVVRAADAEEFKAAGLRLAIPAHFTQDVLGGKPAKLTLGGQGEGLEGDSSSLQVKRAAYTVLADVIATSELSGKVTLEALAALDARPRSLTLSVSMAGDRRDIPQGFEQTIPGTMTMMTLLVMLTSGAVGLLIERREGLLRRLAFAPMTRGEIVLGQMARESWIGHRATDLEHAGGRLSLSHSLGTVAADDHGRVGELGRARRVAGSLVRHVGAHRGPGCGTRRAALEPARRTRRMLVADRGHAQGHATSCRLHSDRLDDECAAQIGQFRPAGLERVAASGLALGLDGDRFADRGATLPFRLTIAVDAWRGHCEIPRISHMATEPDKRLIDYAACAG